MPKQYEGIGVSFLYPDNWHMTEDSEDDGVVGVTVESPQGAFVAIHRFVGTNDPSQIVENVQQAIDSEYEEVESEPDRLTIADWELNGTVQRFCYLDFIITSRILALEYRGVVYLIQIQSEDRDLERLELVFQAVLVSMLNSLDAK